jgi:3-isopropylmalate dehydratase small subunit
MSKEQTPMEKQLKDWSPLKFNGEMKWRNEDVIEFTKAKVLEALENCCGMSREQAVHAIKRMKQK